MHWDDPQRLALVSARQDNDVPARARARYPAAFDALELRYRHVVHHWKNMTEDMLPL